MLRLRFKIYNARLFTSFNNKRYIQRNKVSLTRVILLLMNKTDCTLRNNFFSNINL